MDKTIESDRGCIKPLNMEFLSQNVLENIYKLVNGADIELVKLEIGKSQIKYYYYSNEIVVETIQNLKNNILNDGISQNTLYITTDLLKLYIEKEGYIFQSHINSNLLSLECNGIEYASKITRLEEARLISEFENISGIKSYMDSISSFKEISFSQFQTKISQDDLKEKYFYFWEENKPFFMLKDNLYKILSILKSGIDKTKIVVFLDKYIIFKKDNFEVTFNLVPLQGIVK